MDNLQGWVHFLAKEDAAEWIINLVGVSLGGVSLKVARAELLGTRTKPCRNKYWDLDRC